jgi:hypothetical protein
MQIVQVPSSPRFRLTESFLSPYYAKGDPFASLLARPARTGGRNGGGRGPLSSLLDGAGAASW